MKININMKYINYLVLITLLVCGSAFAQDSGKIWQESYRLESAGRYALAINSMDSILHESPKHELALLRRAWLNYSAGYYNVSEREYRQVLSLYPKSLDAQLALTLPLIAQQRWREATIEAYKVIKVSAWNYTAHVRLMACEEGERKWKRLSHHASELAVRYPTDATALVYLARAEAWRGNIQNARSSYVKVLELIPAQAEATAYLQNNR